MVELKDGILVRLRVCGRAAHDNWVTDVHCAAREVPQTVDADNHSQIVAVDCVYAQILDVVVPTAGAG